MSIWSKRKIETVTTGWKWNVVWFLFFYFRHLRVTVVFFIVLCRVVIRFCQNSNFVNHCFDYISAQKLKEKQSFINRTGFWSDAVSAAHHRYLQVLSRAICWICLRGFFVDVNGTQRYDGCRYICVFHIWQRNRLNTATHFDAQNDCNQRTAQFHFHFFF